MIITLQVGVLDAGMGNMTRHLAGELARAQCACVSG